MTRKNLSVALVLIPALILSACAGTPAAVVTNQAPSAIVQTTSTLARGVKALANAAASQLMLPTPTVPVAPVSAPKDTAASQPQTGASADLSGFQSELEAVYQKVNPSVVSIDVIIGAAASTRGRTSPFGNSGGVSAALGSGFVWDKDGHIVTNNHVVSGATQITVTFASGESFDAKLVGSDPNADIAVIKINAPAALLVPVEVGETSQVKVGQVAIAIGNPYGLSNTMTQGIISALSRSLPVESSSGNSTTASSAAPTYSIPDIIQTDAAINPGNSGGVLVDISGKLIGITAAISSSTDSNSGIGFVIPSEIVAKVVPALVKTGVFQHPYLGITGTNLTAELAAAMKLDAAQRGALVIDVTAGGPADKAGLKASTQTTTINGSDIPVGGDVIVAINGQKVSDFDDLSSYIFIHTNAGETVDLTVLRGGKEVSLKLTVGTMPK